MFKTLRQFFISCYQLARIVMAFGSAAGSINGSKPSSRSGEGNAVGSESMDNISKGV